MSTPSYSYFDVFTVTGAGVNSVPVSAWRASRFSAQPAYNDAPPSGSADATATTGTGTGMAGSFMIQLPSLEDYYLQFNHSSINYWKFVSASRYLDGLPFGTSPAPAGTLGIGTTETSSGFNGTPSFIFVGGLLVDATSTPSGYTKNSTLLSTVWGYLPSDGGQVLLPAGTIPLQTPLSIPANVLLKGVGSGHPGGSGSDPVATMTTLVAESGSGWSGSYVVEMTNSGSSLMDIAIDASAVDAG